MAAASLIGTMKGVLPGVITQLLDAGCVLDLTIDGTGRKEAQVGKGKDSQKAYVFTGQDEVCGTATVILTKGKPIEHYGLKVELIGRFEAISSGVSDCDFFSISKDLEPAGVLSENKTYNYRFSTVDKVTESYSGSKLQVRYFVRISMQRSLNNISKELPFAVQKIGNPIPELENKSIRMEVGVEDHLHIEFEYESSQYNLKDVVVGKVYFLLVKLQIHHMQIDILRKEFSLKNGTSCLSTETVTKFEIMDGSPVKAECIPVRMYLESFDLSPTVENLQNQFSVKYYMNLILVDKDDRRYFKQSEIRLWRKSIG